MVAGLIGKKAAFAALLEGKAPAATDPNLAQLANIASRLSTVPQPTAAFRAALRDQLMTAAGHGATGATGAAPHAAAHLPAAHNPTVPAPRVSTPHTAPNPVGHGLGSGSTAATGSGAGASSSSFAGSLTSGLAGLGKTAPVWAKVFAGVAAIGVSATGVAVGAQRALPGDLFYGVKKQVEAVQLDLASGAHEKAVTEFGFAQARINELNKLIQRDHVVAGQPVSSETAAHMKDLLENWAENTGVATTSMIQQIEALGSSTTTAEQSAALRNQLSTFTNQQFAAVGKLLGSMPTASLQSLTVSALGYLQRVDAVLGHDPASLIAKLPVSLNSVPGVSKMLPRLVLPSSIATTGGKAVLPGPSSLQSLIPGGLLNGGAGSTPTDVPIIKLPSTGTGITLPSTGTGISLPSLGSIPQAVPSAVQSIAGAVGSQLPGTVQSVAGAVQSAGGVVASQLPGAVQSLTASAGNAGNAANAGASAVTGALGAITGGVTPTAGPSLPLPVSLPVLPKLPGLP